MVTITLYRNRDSDNIFQHVGIFLGKETLNSSVVRPKAGDLDRKLNGRLGS